MEENVVSFETAKLAKEKGFDIEVKNWYDQTETLNPCKRIRGAMYYQNVGYAPTQSLLQKWLREHHKLIVTVGYKYDYDNTPYTFFIYNEGSKARINKLRFYEDFEDALEEGLFEALKQTWSRK